MKSDYLRNKHVKILTDFNLLIKIINTVFLPLEWVYANECTQIYLASAISLALPTNPQNQIGDHEGYIGLRVDHIVPTFDKTCQGRRA